MPFTLSSPTAIPPAHKLTAFLGSVISGARGFNLIDVPGYTFRIFVTNRNVAPLGLWRDYNKRAVIEQRTEEIKAELHADDFCMKNFFATESAFWRCSLHSIC